ILNIAKEALLAHQTAISVVGHNVANVDTPGYTRQTLSLTPSAATPESVGFIGNGVRAESVTRHYDQFMVQRLIDQHSNLSNLEAQQQSLRIVETSFNEAPGMAVNELLSEFWSGWQTLTDNAELLSSRVSVVQQAELINEQFRIMSSELDRVRHDIGTNLQFGVNDVNSLTQQIAALNSQITGTESNLRQQNDLRDQRDLLVKDLAQLLEINYFEVGSGSYTILMSDGHALVENNESWSVDWADNKLQWISRNAKGTEIRNTLENPAELGGKIGGWIEVHDQIAIGQPENYLGRLDAMANALIREVNQQHSQGVGLVRFSDVLTSAEIASNPALLEGRVNTVTAFETIPPGTFTINDREIGKIEGGVLTHGLAMTKTYNAAQAINDALAGVQANMTTQLSSDAMTAMAGPEVGTNIDFQINGIDINYTIQAGDTVPATLANNLVNTITNAITAHNDPTASPENIPKITIEAVVGDGTNGGAVDSIILRNTNAGDESRIVIAGIESDTTNPLYITENKLGLTNGEYVTDATHNTGVLSLFAQGGSMNISGGTNDEFLAHLGLDGGNLSATDKPDDGKIFFQTSDNAIPTTASLMGYDYADELQTDGGSFKIWLYNNDGTLSLPTPVEVSMERAYDLNDVVDAINISITNASGSTPPWVEASIYENRLVLTPDGDHQFAFGGDTSNFLATAGINTFFTGYSASTIDVNETVSESLENLAAGTVNSNGEIFKGDQSNGLLITNIQRDEYVRFRGSAINTLDGHYNSLVAQIGMESRTVNRDLEFNALVTNQLEELRDSTSGVSLDEEMSNLIKFQHAYSAAAKLITTADEMLLTLLQAV
ncbi:MAG: flagellar hook-associated protein FlgK, partial [Desulfobulbaceae bacterium]|nr:flagellar hook-associated protein FlgK [Desulfobulbaceae bacterium]